MKTKKLFSMIMSIAIVSSFSTTVFAAENIDGKQICAQEKANIVEKITDVENINGTISEEKTSYVVQGGTTSVDIPKAGNENISLSLDGYKTIGLGLPEGIEEAKPIVTDNGTFIYDSNKDSTVAVQATQEFQEDLLIEAVKCMVTIENSKAPNKYSFEYDLPDGYELIKSEDYYTNEEDIEPGWVYIVDKKNVFFDIETGEQYYDIVAVIEPAWAKDAKGNAVETYYEVVGNQLIQTVKFNENSCFPIVADPTTSSKPANVLLESYPDSFKISHAALGIPSLSADAASRVVKKEIQDKIKLRVAAKFGASAIPVLSNVLFVIETYCTIQGLRGYNYTRVSYVCEKWRIYKHQGGRWVGGYQYRISNLDIDAIK